MTRYFLISPFCCAKVPLPDGEADDEFKVTGCLECDAIFDYDPRDVRTEPSSSG